MKLSSLIRKLFHEEITLKYQVYNSFFSSLPYEKIDNIGMLLPLLYDMSKTGLDAGKHPKQIIDAFFRNYAHIHDEKAQLDLLFFIIQYVERQVVLFDSVEDAAFNQIHQHLPMGTLSSAYLFVHQNNLKEQIKAKLKTLKIRLVYTAHPTQFYPNDVLRIISDIQKAIADNDIIQITTLLQQLGKTPFINKQKPTPLQEARSIMYYIRFIHYETIGLLNDKLHELFLEEEDSFTPVLELGFWPGGDRDGNPFVNAETTYRVAQELKHDILKCYYQDIKELVKRLTFVEVKDLVVSLRNRIYQNLFEDKDDIDYAYLIEISNEIKKKLTQKHDGFFVNLVNSFIRKVQTFGLYFASIDIRQDSSKHKEIMEIVVKKYVSEQTSYEQMPEDAKRDFLVNQSFYINEEDFEDAIHQDTIKNIKQLGRIQKENGVQAVHRYIISNSTTEWNVLEVLALFRFCGYRTEEIHFDIVPLFETIEGLDAAHDTMHTLYNLPFYSQHLAQRGNKQTVMLGFSDGTKDGGYVKANWEIYQSKERLTSVSRSNDVEIVFFDGRGGPPARGGGKTHQFYASQGQTIASSEIHLTIQGQTITSQYGSVHQALYNFEQLVTAGLLSGFSPRDNAYISKKGRDILNELSKISYEKYIELKNHPLFIPYLEQKSVLKYYANTNIGSRPSKRTSASTALSLSSLRAIPFVGSWSQLKQNVPGYYGFGEALEKFISNHQLEDLQTLYKESLYFKTLVQNSMMALTKTYFPLTGYIEKDELFGDFWKMLYKEYKLSVKNLLLVSQEDELMQREVLNQLSIQHREKIVLPLLVIQQYALQKIHKNPKNSKIYQKIVMRSVFGNINASRNSA